MKNYITVSNFERKKKKTGNTFNSIPQLKYLINWDGIYIYWGYDHENQIKFHEFCFNRKMKYCPLEMKYQIYLLILFSNDMKKVGFIEPNNTSFYVPQQLNNLWQWTLLTHSILYSVIWFVTRDRKTFLMGSTQPMRVAQLQKYFFDN